MKDNNVFKEVLGSRFDFELSVTPRCRYAILSVPRCGSTLLGSMLLDSKKAGAPFEYFHELALKEYLSITMESHLNLGDYLRHLEKRRTSPNGFFGVKLHWYQFERIFKKSVDQEGLRYLSSMDKIIRIYREDKVAQAISLFLAYQTGVWFRSGISGMELDEKQSTDDVQFDPAKIAWALSWLINQEESWVRFLDSAGLQYESISYEALKSDYEYESRKVLNFLGVNDFEILEPKLKRMSGEKNKILKENFMEYLKS